MRILKRNLAFMLTLAMMLGVMVSASAMNVKDYTDYNEIKFVEAIDVLTSLGVLEGEGGKFNPQNTLTREQGAKIISYVMLGKNGAEGLTTSVAPFSDVAANRWSAGYVAYCASQGIINGVGGGKFDPEATLTANQFAKMLLVALGYGVNNEYVGANWEIEASKQALLEGIFDNNLGANFADGVKREEAALYAFNALTNAMTVSYSETFGTYYSGKLFNSVDEFDEKYTLGYKLYNVTKKDTTDDFGRDAHYWVKNNVTKVSNTYSDVADASYTAQVKTGTIYADLGLTKTNKAEVIRNGEPAGMVQLKKNSSAKLPGSGNGVLVEAFVDDYENVTIIMIDTFLAEVATVDEAEGEITVNVLYGNAPKFDNKYETSVEYKEDDFVLITVAAGEIQSVKAAESETGKMDVYATSYVTMDGTKMNKAQLLKDDDTSDKSKYFVNDYDSVMKVYFDEYGYVVAVVTEEEAEVEYSFVQVTGSEFKANTLLNSKAAVVEVMHLDGTTEVLPLDTRKEAGEYQYKAEDGEWKEITEDKYVDGKLVPGSSVADGFYRFTMTDEGEIVLKALDAKKAAGYVYNKEEGLNGADVSFNKEQKGTIKVGGKAVLADKFMNSNTVYHQVADETEKTFTGYKNIDIDAKNATVLVLYNGRIITDIYTFDSKVASSEIKAYYDGTKFETKDGTKVTLYIDGEAANYVLADKVAMTAEGAYTVEITDNEVTKAALVAEEANAEKVLTANETYFEVVKDTKHYYAEDVEVFDITDGGAAAAVAKNDYVIFVEEDGFVTLVYIVEEPKEESADPSVDPETKYTIEVAKTAKNAVNVTVNGAKAEDTVKVVGMVGAAEDNTAEGAGNAAVAYTSFASGAVELHVYVNGVYVGSSIQNFAA